MESDTSALLMAGMVYTIPEKGLIQGQWQGIKTV
jgi:hypothetical protein